MQLPIAFQRLWGRVPATGEVRALETALEETRATSEQLRLVTDSVPILISYVDANQHFQFNNAAYEEWFGIPRDSMRGRHVRDVIGVEIYQTVRENIEAALRGLPRVFEIRLPRRDGACRNVRVHYVPHRNGAGEVVGFFALITDLTRGREMEQALREERDFVSTLLEVSGALIIVLDAKGRVVRFNRACEQLSGYTSEEMEGKSVWRLVPAEQRKDVSSVFDALLGGLTHNTFENEWLTKDGSRRRIAWSNAALGGDDGELRYVIATGIDITERQLAESELRRSRGELRSLSARLLTAEENERRRLSRELHDSVNQSLGMLAVEVEFLIEKAKRSSALRRDLGNCRDRILELSDNVRRLAYELHPAILDDLGLAVALRSYVGDLSKRTGIRVTLTEKNLPRRLDKGIASCLYRVAQESLGNAAKHSKSDRISVRLVAGYGGCCLLIRDFGRGFDPEAVREHHGLGLISMEERVRMEGGRLDVKTSPGRGTRVRVWLPMQARDT